MRCAYSSRITGGRLWNRLLPPPLGRPIPRGERGLADDMCVFLKDYAGALMRTTSLAPPTQLGRLIPEGKRGLADAMCVFLEDSARLLIGIRLEINGSTGGDLQRGFGAHPN